MSAAGWSTAEVARLAGVSARTVRYYHEIGILPEPRRRANGYKSYDVWHLTRLVRVRRLVQLGLTLEQIRALDADQADAGSVFQELELDIAVRIEELEHIRRSLRAALDGEVRAGLPPGFDPGEITAQITEQDEAVLAVLHRMLPESQRAGLREWLPTSVDSAADDEFAVLPETATEELRAGLAQRMLPAALAAARHRGAAPAPDATSARDIGIALTGIYNTAQMDVLTRVATLLDNDTNRTESDR